MAPKKRQWPTQQVVDEPAGKHPKLNENLRGPSTAPASASGDQLKPRPPEIHESLRGILDAIQQADLQPTSVQMLTAGVSVLEVPPAERHEVHVRIIRMIEEVMQQVKTKLEKEVTLASERIARLEASKEAFESQVSAASEAMTATALMSETKAFTRCEASEKVKAAEEVIKEKKQAHSAAEMHLQVAKEDRDKLAAAQEEIFNPLVDWACGEEGALAHQQALLPLLQGLGLEESCLVAAPTSCLKPPAERNNIDAMAFQEIGRALEARTAQLAQGLADHAAQVEAAAGGLAAAAAGLDTARSFCVAAVDEGREATSREKQARDAALAAQRQLDNFAPNWERVVAERTACIRTLEAYNKHIMGSFWQLKQNGAEEVSAEVQRGH